MTGFRRVMRPYRIFALLTMAMISMPDEAPARLPDFAPSLMITYVSAIHRPTGCAAVLEFDENTLIGALITDPLCLPVGIKARSVPAFKRDFHLPASWRNVFRGH